MGRLFGTDGARGIANQELTCELAMNIGKAAAMVLTDHQKHPRILIGKDTRLSCDMLEGALLAGLCSIGADVELLGVVPTPAVAYLVKKYHADAGIMISASHNSFEFNGIKIFSKDGYKLPDAMEAEIEAIILDHAKPYALKEGEEIGKVTVLENAADDYIEHIAASVATRLDGMRFAVDCSNGSASRTAKKLFAKLGAECDVLFDQPDGVNINKECGSTHLENLRKYVLENKLEAGFAFDGDADRCLAVDGEGNIIDGDFILAVCAKELKAKNKLKNNTVVGTVMSNMGFGKFCEENDIHFVAANVGDRYVLEEMLKNGYCLGGEQSGHVIFLDYATTGDGQLTAVQVLSMLKEKNMTLAQAASVMKQYPQVLVNVKVSKEGKEQFPDNSAVHQQIENVRTQLGDSGRILVRVSGTEPLIRVMLEGENLSEIQRLADETAEVIKKELCS